MADLLGARALVVRYGVGGECGADRACWIRVIWVLFIKRSQSVGTARSRCPIVPTLSNWFSILTLVYQLRA